MRYRNSLLSLAVLLVATGSNASQTLGFTFAPLHCTAYDYFPGPPSTGDCGFTSLSGTFTFNDINSDGHVVLTEVLNLSMPGISAPGPGYLGQPDAVTAFDYSPTTGLSFSASAYRYSVTTGVAYRYDAPYGSSVEAWVDTTKGTVYQISSVPEPRTAWLLLAGCALFALRRPPLLDGPSRSLIFLLEPQAQMASWPAPKTKRPGIAPGRFG